MTEGTSAEPQSTIDELRAEIARQQKVIDALMRRAERTNTAGSSAFNLFETTVMLKDQVRHRTEELNTSLRENEKVTRALQQATAQMQREIEERRKAQEALKAANQNLEKLSLIEPLTGLSNRRSFERVLQLEWARAQEHHRALGAAMIDIDKFKLYNDRYGHLAGDECLRKVASALQSSVRHRDLVARYGGEEIVLILPGADLEIARRVGERARAAVANLAIPHADFPLGIVTVSVGVASMAPKTNEKTAQLIAMADDALYQAKENGRNRVCVMLPESDTTPSAQATPTNQA